MTNKVLCLDDLFTKSYLMNPLHWKKIKIEEKKSSFQPATAVLMTDTNCQTPPISQLPIQTSGLVPINTVWTDSQGTPRVHDHIFSLEAGLVLFLC